MTQLERHPGVRQSYAASTLAHTWETKEWVHGGSCCHHGALLAASACQRREARLSEGPSESPA